MVCHFVFIRVEINLNDTEGYNNLLYDYYVHNYTF